ncbi:hypothetical protein NMG60_11006005 [Bertholletia excelsa]
MSKATTLFLLVLFLCSALSSAARPDPRPLEGNLVETQHGGDETVDVSCQGVGDEECLMRRTLAAHTDYIYTQKHNNP